MVDQLAPGAGHPVGGAAAPGGDGAADGLGGGHDEQHEQQQEPRAGPAAPGCAARRRPASSPPADWSTCGWVRGCCLGAAPAGSSALGLPTSRACGGRRPMNSLVGRVRQVPSATRTSTQACTSSPRTIPSRGTTAPTTTRAGTPSRFAIRAIAGGVLLVVADRSSGQQEALDQPVEVVPGLVPALPGAAVAVAALAAQVVRHHEQLAASRARGAPAPADQRVDLPDTSHAESRAGQGCIDGSQPLVGQDRGELVVVVPVDPDGHHGVEVARL